MTSLHIVYEVRPRLTLTILVAADPSSMLHRPHESTLSPSSHPQPLLTMAAGDDWTYYAYRPRYDLAYMGIALFAAAFVVQLFLTLRRRTWYVRPSSLFLPREESTDERWSR